MCLALFVAPREAQGKQFPLNDRHMLFTQGPGQAGFRSGRHPLKFPSNQAVYSDRVEIFDEGLLFEASSDCFWGVGARVD